LLDRRNRSGGRFNFWLEEKVAGRLDRGHRSWASLLKLQPLLKNSAAQLMTLQLFPQLPLHFFGFHSRVFSFLFFI
jgi:hypothetical protein